MEFTGEFQANQRPSSASMGEGGKTNSAQRADYRADYPVGWSAARLAGSLAAQQAAAGKRAQIGRAHV